MSGGRRSGAYDRDPQLPTVFSRATARRAGLTDRQINYRLARGVWISVRPGWYRLSTNDRAGRADWRIGAFLAAHRGRDLAVSHTSAALLHNLPKPLTGWGSPTGTAAEGSTRITSHGSIKVAPLLTSDLTTMRGVTTTSLARTVADCLRVLAPQDGLAMVDAALRAGLPLPDLHAVLRVQAGWPGIARARTVVALADGRRESPLESWSAWAFDRNGVTAPQWQMDLLDDGGAWCGRVDCWWEEGLAGEADGKAKYRLAAAARRGTDAERLAKILDEERERERRIRDTRADVIRWGAVHVLNTGRAQTLSEHVISTLTHLRRFPVFTGSTRRAAG